MLCRMPTQTMLCPWINRTVSGGWENIPKCSESFRVTFACGLREHSWLRTEERPTAFGVVEDLYLAVVCRRDKVALSFYKIALEGDTQQEGLHERHGLEAWSQGSVR